MTQEMIELLALGLVGPIVGSFIGLVTLRLPAGRPIAMGRSACDGCGKALTPLDLVPLASWAMTRGRCSCGARIPWRYPLIEAGCAALGLWAGAAFDGAAAAVSAAFAWWLLAIAVIDAEHYWLPRALTLPLAIAGIAAGAWLTPERLPHQIIGVAAGWSGLALLAFAYRRLRGREGLGGGDPVLLGALGAWVGWQGLPSILLVASLAGLVAAVALRRTRADARLPFGTFLALAGWLVWVIGPVGLQGR